MRIVILQLIIALASVFMSSTLNAQVRDTALLLRDSLDYTVLPNNSNSNGQEFSPIAYKNGYIYVSNKKTTLNKIGYNKVYWIGFDQLLSIDTVHAEKASKIHNAHNQISSNDNQILFNIQRKKIISVADSVEAKFIEFIPEHSFTVDAGLNRVIYAKKSVTKINGQYHWQLWEAKLEEGKLKQAYKINMPSNAANYFYPYLTEDGKTLYFASNIVGGKGGYDIYKVIKSDKGWSNTIENINELNTSANEIAPAIYRNSLYFSSNRSGGMGGYDLYLSQIGKPIENLGYPINSQSDELGLIRNEDKLLLQSNRNQNLDFYAFTHKPLETKWTGTIVNAVNGQPLNGINIALTDKALPSNKQSFKTNENGFYSIVGKPNRNYEVVIKGEGVDTTFSLNTSLSSFNATTLNTSLRVNKIDINTNTTAKVVIEQLHQKQSFVSIIDSLKSLTTDFTELHHPFNKATIVKEDLSKLARLIEKVKRTKGASIVIVSASDCIGTSQYNEALSLQRANRLNKTLAKLNNNQMFLYPVGENQLVISCEDATNKRYQALNRYSYVFIIEASKK